MENQGSVEQVYRSGARWVSQESMAHERPDLIVFDQEAIVTKG